MPTSLAALNTELDALGFTDPVLRSAGVGSQPWDGPNGGETQASMIADFRLRCSLFMAALRAMRTYLRTELPQQLVALGLSWERVRPALEDPALLARYAMLLDKYAIAGLTVELGGEPNFNWGAPLGPYTSLENFFTTYVLTPQYDDYIDGFYHRFITARAAVTRATDQFRRNIHRVCQRVLVDLVDLRTAFATNFGALIQIVTTGSDSHKGGQQVLKLQFALEAPGDGRAWLIYKPSALELDCRLVGDSAAVNAVYPDFMGESLVEIVNRLSDQNPAYRIPPLPTYRILPRLLHFDPDNPGSLADCYGYVQFLTHTGLVVLKEEKGEWFIGGASDFRFYQENRQTRELIQKHAYLVAGAFMALAATFSIIDLHMENVIFSGFVPHLIDLEVSLSDAIRYLEQTALIGEGGGFTGATHRVGGWRKVRRVGANADLYPLYYVYDTGYFEEYAANRLATVEPNALVDIRWAALLEGLERTLNLLGENADAFNPWYGGLNGVLARCRALPTGFYVRWLNQVYFQGNPSYSVEYKANDQAAKAYSETAKGYSTLHENQAPPLPPPIFETANPIYLVPALVQGDIPCFYRRIDEQNVYDSRGQPVVIPNNGQFTVPRGGNFVNINLNRNTWYAAPPTTTYVRPQLQYLVDPVQRAQRFAALRQEIVETHLGGAALPQLAVPGGAP